MAKTTATGTGQHSTVAPSRGSSLTKTTVGNTSTRSMNAPQAQPSSQRFTTAPKVKMPSVTFVKDTKARTRREVLVDGYNNANPATPGGKNKLTELEREYKQIAGGNNPGTGATMPGRPKQAQ